MSVYRLEVFFTLVANLFIYTLRLQKKVHIYSQILLCTPFYRFGVLLLSTKLKKIIIEIANSWG